MYTPLVIGHACAGGEAPHNTLAGVRACLATGAHAMEIDVQLSADGIPVLMHDNTVDRTTNLSGPVSAFTAAKLAAADAGDGEKVPTLREVLDLVDARLTVMCELKRTEGNPEQDARLVGAVLGVIRERRAETWAAIHSFNTEIVEQARAAEPRVSAAVISPAVQGEARDRLFAGALKRHAQALSVHHSCIDRGFVVAAKRRQLTLWTWTPDEEAEWARLCDAGVDGIITNYPTRLTRFLASRS
jgi:glycerophosphoryl diester phosphodiesterase